MKRDHDNTHTTAHEIAAILLQGILAYDQDPTLESYTGFVWHMDGTALQLSRATIPRAYFEELFQGKPLTEGLHVLRSELFDLRECAQRRDALRLIIGFFKFLYSKKK